MSLCCLGSLLEIVWHISASVLGLRGSVLWSSLDRWLPYLSREGVIWTVSSISPRSLHSFQCGFLGRAVSNQEFRICTELPVVPAQIAAALTLTVLAGIRILFRCFFVRMAPKSWIHHAELMRDAQTHSLSLSLSLSVCATTPVQPAAFCPIGLDSMILRTTSGLGWLVSPLNASLPRPNSAVSWLISWSFSCQKNRGLAKTIRII